MSDPLGLVHRRTRLVEAILPSVSKTAGMVLEKALEVGLREWQGVGHTQMWNVSVQLWLDSGRFSCTLDHGRSFPAETVLSPQDFYPSSLITNSTLPDVMRQLKRGHVSVAVYESLVPYFEAGGEPSVHALVVTLLKEARRVTSLGFPVCDRVQRLLDAFYALDSNRD